jgi:hypothetical protein
MSESKERIPSTTREQYKMGIKSPQLLFSQDPW